MNGNSHPWSSDPEGQAAIRAAEPDRGPTLAHHEVPAMVEKLGAALVATHTSLSKVDRAIALALEGVADRVARLEGWIDNRRAARSGATSVADAYAVAARQAEAAARDHTSTFVMPDPMRSDPEGPVEWRILKAEETILEGDQYQGQGQWFETNAAGTRLPVGHPVTYRRRVKSTAAPAANAGGEDVVVVPQTVVAGNFAQIHWNTCCRLHRMAMDKAGVRWKQGGAEFAFGSLDVGANPLHAAPAANAGGEAKQEPVAWGVLMPNQDVRTVCLFRNTEEKAKENFPPSQGWTHFPLYSAPQPPRGWLTEDERKCLTFLLDNVCVSIETDKCIKALLARSTLPRVRRPPFPGHSTAVCVGRDAEWVAAIRDAGVEVAE